ncbi:hypothetical protein FBU59_004839 [Linderina macrospora]|uniref:Uncharacterized protein n=1 Tax=Linderina macrospora TaxID=4868 RepID=A0ACC1J4B2_9FUNG|nr:hypothetical protein FBU59_004839 [Linderina macrospora]
MAIHSVFIINKAGGLIYNRDYSTNIAKLSSNEALILAGTFHGIHALASRISPVSRSEGGKDTGIQTIDTANFRIHCYQTATGIKFIAVTDPSYMQLSDVLARMYGLYSDYALKNPFHNLEMPVRSELFDTKLQQLIQSS